MRSLCFLALLALAGCGAADTSEEELSAVRAATMSGPRITWEELDIHPALAARACAVNTLVTRGGTTVGYCRDGRSCRTMDWRPIEDGCRAPLRSAARQ